MTKGSSESGEMKPAKSGDPAIGARLREARNAAAYTLQAAAEAFTAHGAPLKIGKAGLGHWENAVNDITASQLRVLCRLYKVSADQLVLGETRGWPFSAELLKRVSEIESDPEELRHAENVLRAHFRLEPLAAEPQRKPEEARRANGRR